MYYAPMLALGAYTVKPFKGGLVVWNCGSSLNIKKANKPQKDHKKSLRNIKKSSAARAVPKFIVENDQGSWNNEG